MAATTAGVSVKTEQYFSDLSLVSGQPSFSNINSEWGNPNTQSFFYA